METTDNNNQFQSKADQIIAAAESLAKRGEKVTGQKVRDELGGMSFSTITPILRKWRESQQKANTAVATLPENLREKAIQFVGAIYKDCEEEAKQDNRKIKAQHKDELADLEAENDEQAREIEKLEEKLTEAENERLRVVREYDQMEADHNGLKVKQARMEENTTTLTRDLKDYTTIAQDLRSKYDKLVSDSSRLKGLTDSQQEEITKNQATITTLNQQVQDLNSHSDRYKDQAERLRQEKETLSSQQDELTSTLKKLETENTTLKETLNNKDRTIETLNKSIADQKETQDRYQSLRIELETAKARLREVVQESGELKRENKDLHKQQGSLEAQLTAYQERLNALNKNPKSGNQP
ncbi:MAG: DNA-binding protein [Shewanella sp.]|nr:DNA-binding protein [Shewanella sp.]MCF1437189.1 DNA-binding protein [Shewanella sp.]MCF1459497.1 DNA-binding protein [Shewanella sp.]